MTEPQSGTRIDYREGKLVVPDDPIVPFIEGDGTGPDIWHATQYVLDGTVAKVYGGKKKFHCIERRLRQIFAGRGKRFVAREHFEPMELFLATVNLGHRSVEDVLRGVPDVGTGAVTLDEGNDGIVGDDQF